MTHLLVNQLRFARSEFSRALDGVSAEDAVRRIMPLNCISWMVGHLANQENRYWVSLGQSKILAPGLMIWSATTSPPVPRLWTKCGQPGRKLRPPRMLSWIH